MAQNDKKIPSAALHISGIIYHMIAIYGTLVQNDIAMLFFNFIFQNSDFLGC